MLDATQAYAWITASNAVKATDRGGGRSFTHLIR
jgi:hypothetical protein